MENRPINRNWVTGRAVVDKVPMPMYHDLPLPEGDQFPQTRETLQLQGPWHGFERADARG